MSAPAEAPPLVETVAAICAWSADRRRSGQRIALVPTMGALHAGHESLLRAGRERADALVMSLFVNPTQFGPGEDLARYPRDLEGDLERARGRGVDVVFAPSAEEMYSAGDQTRIAVGALAEPLCGASRPGHFAGVATVVAKLFAAIQPDIALFGEKDFQQLAVIRRLVADLHFPVEIVGMPIVREADGVAMSSRNRYLSAAERTQAVSIARGLGAATRLWEEGERNAARLVCAAREPIAAAPAARIDYLELRDAESLREIAIAKRPAVLAAAVYFGTTRLIDNTVLGR